MKVIDETVVIGQVNSRQRRSKPTQRHHIHEGPFQPQDTVDSLRYRNSVGRIFEEEYARIKRETHSLHSTMRTILALAGASINTISSHIVMKLVGV